jgi:hypothetical protein
MADRSSNSAAAAMSLPLDDEHYWCVIRVRGHAMVSFYHHAHLVHTSSAFTYKPLELHLTSLYMLPIRAACRRAC